MDASKEGLGAVLSQKQADGSFHLVANGSWALTAHEKNYHSTKLEFLALKWAITEHFKEYLLYQHFLVNTDNNPLTYIMTTSNLDATGHQWVGAPSKIQFPIGILERMRKHIGRHIEPDYHSSWARGHASHSRWSNYRCFPESGRRKLCCDQR